MLLYDFFSDRGDYGVTGPSLVNTPEANFYTKYVVGMSEEDVQQVLLQLNQYTIPFDFEPFTVDVHDNLASVVLYACIKCGCNLDEVSCNPA